MTDAPTRAELDGDPERIAWRSRTLEALAGLGLGLARAVQEEALGPGRDAARLCKLTEAFDRVGRAIRLTVALAERLDEARRTGQPIFLSPPAAVAPPQTALETERERPDGPEGREGRERPDRESLLREARAEAALMARPPAELYIRICRDLGAAPDPDLFPDNDDAPPASAPPRTAGVSPAMLASSRPSRARLFGSAAAAPLAGAVRAPP